MPSVFDVKTTLNNLENDDIEVQRTGLQSLVSFLKLKANSYDELANELAKLLDELDYEKQLCALGAIDFIVRTAEHKLLMETPIIELLIKYIQTKRSIACTIKFCDLISSICASKEGYYQAYKSKVYKELVPLLKHDDSEVQVAVSNSFAILLKDLRSKIATLKDFPELPQHVFELTSEANMGLVLALTKLLIQLGESPVGRPQLDETLKEKLLDRMDKLPEENHKEREIAKKHLTALEFLIDPKTKSIFKSIKEKS